jgi:plasmid stability protein
VATLNIKNMPDRLYKKLKAQAIREHRSISQEATHLLAEALDVAAPLSILELEGLGKEVWKGVEAAAHVERERRSWS